MADPGSSQGPWYPPVIRIGDDDDALPPQPAQWNPVRAVPSARVDTSDLGDRSKLRKVERACDHCRKRKAKCDGPQRKNHICSTCEALSKTCTYLEDPKPRGPPRAYILALEERLAKAEALVRRLRPELDMTAELGPSPLRADRESRGASHGSAMRVSSNPSGSLDNRIPQGNDKPIPIPPILPPLDGANPKPPPPVPPLPHTPPPQKIAPPKRAKGKRKRTRNEETAGPSNTSHRSSTSYESSDSQHQVEVTYPKGARLTYRGLESSNHAISNDNQLRFQGMSSSVNLLHDALEIIERDLAAMNLSKSDYQPGAGTSTSRTFIKSEPAKLYDLSSWEKRLGRAYDLTGVPDNLLSVFPPDDLAEELIRLYFLHEHTTYPVLHRPTFEREWREQLHKRSVWYACLCMAMFGLASRFASDPRVLPDTAPDVDPRREDTKPLPGWKYMSTNIMVGGAITEDRSGLMLLPELHEMQAIVLMAYYMRGMVGQDTAWYWTGALVMKAQDMGLHREHTYDPVPTLEQELWRRVCWHAISLNRFASMHLGKSCFAREEDVDLFLPLEVDDEYWELDDPEKNFRQPAGKPAMVSGFVQWIKLSDIVVRTLNSLFTARKPDAASLSTAESWEESVVEQLNEMLLKFTDDLPPHLRWKADMGDTPFACQAALLYEMYHVVHALVQRPFLALKQRRRRRPSAASDKALGICVTAARASLAIADAQLQHGTGDVVSALHVLYIGVGTLLMQFWEHVRLWAERRAGDEAEEDAWRMNALLTEIDGPVRRLQEFAPKWEVARAML
ncbi:fungal-specific transcription factor domain-containing protein [Trametes elegans]|nr:fungal-specific transcription factor domain-containing protein [Trametes elegans]